VSDSNHTSHEDEITASAFASSWNNLPPGSIYTSEQVKDWFAPVALETLHGQTVLELGCGSASLLVHVANAFPAKVVGVDLGDSVVAARKNMSDARVADWQIVQADINTFQSEGFDFVYSIGVLHHMKNPHAGFLSVVRNTKAGGRFHCWVYGYEGNAVIRHTVDPLRKLTAMLPWWLTKYCVATPLAALYFLYAKGLSFLPESLASRFPLGAYSFWIAQREFLFFRHVAFDQLVTPQTAYLKRETIEKWIAGHSDVTPQSSYIIQRNGNSWKFGGTRKKEQ
jgi:ubiquinone/menaquinone biosynthesis C-methylase UbiE